jgi:hypothetical protein
MLRFLTLWRWYANGSGLTLIVCRIAYGIMRAFTTEGPVAGPDPDAVVTVVQGGSIAYELTTERRESCPGTVIAAFTKREPGEPTVVVLLSRPVTSAEIRPASRSIFEWALPTSIRPGRWHYASTVDSQCPLRRQQDVIAEFYVEVTPSGRAGD